ncbi:hypothetical protein AB4144_45580, partial [Rhizobiaceae sp. 2RAB30]
IDRAAASRSRSETEKSPLMADTVVAFICLDSSPPDAAQLGPAAAPVVSFSCDGFACCRDSGAIAGNPSAG